MRRREGSALFILFLGWRNILRYRKRSLQTFLIVFLSALCVMLVDAFMRGFAASASDRVVAVSGHLDLHAAGYLDSAEAMPLDLSIPDREAVMGRLVVTAEAALSPGVRALAARSIATGCMLSNGTASRAAQVLAAPPLARTSTGDASETNPLLRGVEAALVSGRYYRGIDDRGALLDEHYASSLGLIAGADLVLLGTDAYGSFSLMETPVIGLVREASLPGGAACLIDLASFAPAFGLEGAATAISLWFVSGAKGELLDGRAEPTALGAVLASLASDPGFETRPFSAISASYSVMFDFLDAFMAGMVAVFGLVAATGMTNAILLSVQGRAKDLGTLRAIALTARQAGLLIYAETTMVSLAAALSALVLGFGVLAILEGLGVGIAYDSSSLASALPDTMRPRLLPGRLAVIAGLSALFPLLATVLPARAVRRMTIRESMSG